MAHGSWIALSLLVCVALAGCSSGLVPSQSQPVCSWSTAPPANHDTVCQIVYYTLSSIAHAEVHDDRRTIRRLVSNPRVAARVIAHAASLQARGVETLHITPSFTLGRSHSGYLGAAFNMVGTSHSGRFTAPQTVYLVLRGGTAKVVDDQPEEEW
jgi:hypothetical protein